MTAPFNTRGIVYDNSPWRPGRRLELNESEDERKLKQNLATKILSNGVEVVVKERNDTNRAVSSKSLEDKHLQTRLGDVTSLVPSHEEHLNNKLHSRFEERIDSSEDDMSYEFIQPSEASQPSICLASPCLCTHLRTDSLEHLNTKLPLIDKDIQYSNPDATDRNSDKSTYYNYESAPSDKIVEKYTEVINDYSNEKEELLTNEKAPEIKHVEKNKIKPSKPSKNKFEVTDLLKLGSLGIKSLSQLAPVFEKMTGGLIKRSETNKNSSTVKPVVKLTSYSVNKRLDSEIDKTEIKQGNFPIYIPVDELETSESHNVYVNTSFHRNLPWGADQKFHGQSSLKQVHESPLVNGGIPISPGEVIRANSDLIVGKPAVGGPLTLSASGIKIQTFPRPDTMDLNQDAYDVADESQRPSIPLSKNDDSFDLRPPQPPNKKLKNAFIDKRPPQTQRPKYFEHQEPYNNYNLYPESNKDVIVHSGNFMGPLHGRPAFLDYTPSLANKKPIRYDEDDEDLSDSSASSSELIKTTLKGRDELKHLNNKPFLVDIQPSKVANILIPKGSSTALIFSGPSEPHKSGQYIDDPLPYQGPGYFGSFNIDAPKTTSVHNVQKGSAHQQEGPHKNLDTYLRPDFLPFKESNNPNKFYRPKYKGNVKRPLDFPPPTSNQETHFQIGPHIAAYNPDIYRPSGNNFEKYNSKNNKHSKIIDKEYENHLAVPPLPPQVKYADNNKPKPFNQRPTIHTKPIHDMKILLNVQHPIPNNYNTENSLPHQITSEIYYAAQGANKLNNPATYSFGFEHSTSQPLSGIPQHSSNQRTNSSFDSKQNSFNDEQKYNQQEVNSNNNANINDFYSVTLNAATNVGENPLTHHNVIGTSIPVTIDGSKHGSNLESTGIPVGANFAIKIEDKPTSYQQFEHNHQHQIDIAHSSHRPDVVVGLHDWDDNFRVSPQFQTTGITSKPEVTTYKTTLSTHSEEQQPHHVVNVQIINAAETPSQNSHANFPMIFNPTTNKYNKDAIKPVTEDVNEADFSDYINRPPKTIHNVPINSHGLYSSNPSLPIDFDINKINKIKIQNVSHNVIPLTSTNENNHPPNFGQKIQNVDIPPFKWSLNRGQKIATSTQKNNNLVSSVSTKLFSHFTTPKYTNTQQHVYNIPAKQETLPTSTKKPDFIENSEEIYDGKDTTEPNYDSEVSLESMTVPKVSSIEEIYPKHNSSTSLLLNEFIETKDHRLNLQDNENSGTQTEKPFKMSQLHSLFSSNEILKPYKGVSMKPSPFKVSAQDNYSHNIKNKTKTKTSVLGLDLNIGEELGQPFTASTPTTRVATTEFYKITTAKPRHKRPIFSLKNNRSTHRNQSEFVSNIITNTVNLSDRKPLTVVNISNERPLSEIYDTISTSSNTSVTEIIDLLPPPVTLPNIISSAEEVIEGMSPPPQRSPITQRNPPTRLPPSPRPFPSRSPPPFRTKPPRTTRPSRPTIKTIPKDGERDEASTLRPTFDILKRRPSYSRNPSYSIPSSAVVETSTRFVRPPNVMNTNSPTTPTFVFPIPNSSGWVTPVSISFPSSDLPEIQPSPVVITETTSTAIFGNDRSTTTEKIEDEIMVIPLDKFYKKTNTSREHSSISTTEENEIYNGQTEKDLHEKEDQNAKEAEPEGSFDYRPRPDLIRPTKVTTQLKNTKPINTALYPPRKEYKPVIRNNKPTIQPEQTLIESSETYIDNDVIKPTETLKVKSPTVNLQKSSTIYPIVESKATILSANTASIDQKDKDDNLIVLPIKTEYKTKAVTLTKTLSEPPETVSTTRFVTLTHTTTVTRTETSLISQSAGATTQTLILTNTETSTLLDIVTEIQTQVLPTTIVETVTKHIPIIKPTTVTKTEVKTQHPLDDVALSSEEVNYVLPKNESMYNIHKDDNDDTLLIIMNKSQNGGHSPTIKTHNEAEYDGAIRNEDVGGDGVSQVLLGEILLAGTPYLESTHIDTPTVIAYSKECQPDCKASRNERCQRVGGLMKCVCRPGFARMFPDRPCKPTYTYSLRLALGRKGDEKLVYRDTLAMNTSADYQELSEATHEGINRMIMQSDLRDVFHGVQINGFEPITIPKENEKDEYDGVVNDFYVQLSDNAHESRLKEVIEKYLRTNNYSLGGTDVFAARELVDRLEVSDFNECLSPLFHDCSEHAECFNLRGTYTCSCKEGFSDLSVSALYPGRICSAEPIGCENCNFHGSCYNRDDDRVLCECFQWYAGPKCQINLKVVLISLGTLGAVLVAILVACVVTACSRRGRNDDQNSQRPPRSIVATCIQSMPVLPQGAMPSKHHMAHDRRALINERTDSGGDSSSVQNVSLPYMPTKKVSHASNKGCKKISIAGERCDSQSASDSRQPCVMIPRAKLFQSSQRRESREVKESVCRKPSMELSTEEKLISYLESGGKNTDDLMRRKPSAESSYSVSKERHHHKPTGALISAGFKVSTTVKPELDQRMNTMIKEDDMSSINKNEYDRRYNTMGNYSQDDIGDWTDAERRIGELTLSEARSVGGTLPTSTGRAASSARLTQQDAHTMAERDLGSTFLLPHVHLYKPEMISNASDVSEFDSL